MTSPRVSELNGAEALVAMLAASGVECCFASPGASEMHFVAALDWIAGVRCVLALFEGVAPVRQTATTEWDDRRA